MSENVVAVTDETSQVAENEEYFPNSEDSQSTYSGKDKLTVLRSLKSFAFLMLLITVIGLVTLCLELHYGDTDNSDADVQHGYLGVQSNNMKNVPTTLNEHLILQKKVNVAANRSLLEQVDQKNVKICPGPNCTPNKLRFRRNANTVTIATQFKKYEECLKAKDAAYDGMFERPVVVLATERQPTTLYCNLCLRPDHNLDNYKLQWRFFPRHGQNVTWQTIKVDEDKTEVTPSGDLIRRRLLVEDSGRYVCYRNGAVFEAVYHVDVLPQEPTVQVFGEGIEGKRSQEDTVLTEDNLAVLSEWGRWTDCNRCDQRGQRMRHGTCTVKLLEPAEGTNYEILRKYPAGIPCRSSLLPFELRKKNEIRKTPSENQLEYCFEPCPTIPPVREIKDEQGNVVEVVQTGQGFISLRDKPPKIPPLVKRKIFYETRGKSTILECPSDEAAHSAVRWQNNSQILDSVQLALSADGRISIDVYNRLIIRRLADCDTAVYTCWIDGRHVATLKVRVIGDNQSSLNDKITIVGVGVSFGLIVYIGIQVKKQHDQYAKALI